MGYSFASTWTNKDMDENMRVDDRLMSKKVPSTLHACVPQWVTRAVNGCVRRR